MSRKPLVVIRPTLAPVRWITVLVTRVVPWITLCRRSTAIRASRSNRAVPSMMASLGSPGVVSSLPVWIRSAISSTRTKSVKVPPTSMPIRIRLSKPGLPLDVDAVVALGRVARDVAVGDVAPHRGGIALARIAVAAAARVAHHQALARLHGVARLRVRVPAVAEGDLAAGARQPAEQAGRRMLGAVRQQG